MANKFKIGDRVRIIESGYTEHASRMAGGTGTVVNLDGAGVRVEVDNGPGPGFVEQTDNGWYFCEDELEYDKPLPKTEVVTRTVTKTEQVPRTVYEEVRVTEEENIYVLRLTEAEVHVLQSVLGTVRTGDSDFRDVDTYSLYKTVRSFDLDWHTLDKEHGWFQRNKQDF